MPSISLLRNPQEGRLRAPWRLLLQTLLLLVLATATLLVLSPLSTRASPLALNTLVMAVAVALSVAIAARVLDRRPLADLGLHIDRQWWLDCGFGLALGAGLQTLLFAGQVATGLVVVTDVARVTPALLGGVVGALAMFVAVGVYEEVLSRGYQLTNVAEGLRGYLGHRGAVAVAVLLTSVLFGALHAANPNATAVSVLGISLAGVWLALGYVLTGELAIPIGAHISWNFFLGVVYGLPVSGNRLDASFVEAREVGPDLFTGGSFGPEAGLLGIAAVAVGCVAIVGYVGARDGRVPLAAAVTVPELLTRE
ncbi:CPBP family intramembrane glutamic endopeptidase [Halomarina ordinaria]|uniref:CPBP family intramembrane glutamic endopeptidase n=1 Tax=Halomarina ordinaria TaxID=3033939 RepID=A0ABD5UEA5_9EURY|nr:type II CAAX endopeptidase family protein [Halomarina sp. PSRA2]